MADPTTVEVCLQTTDIPSAVCGRSSSQGQLAGIFFDSSVLSAPRAQLGFEGGDFGIGMRCAENNLTTCGIRGDVSGLNALYKFDYGLEITSGGSWTGDRSARLGCFYMTGPRSIQLPLDGWHVGLSYVDTDGGTYSRMFKPLFTPAFPQLGVPESDGVLDLRVVRTCDYGVLNMRLPTADAHAQSCLTCTEATMRLIDYQLVEVSRLPHEPSTDPRGYLIMIAVSRLCCSRFAV